MSSKNNRFTQNKNWILIGLIAIVGMSFSIFTNNKKTKLFLMGDSTMCEYPSSRAPLAGWGMPFKQFFDSSIEIENHARGGRSTRTFIAENRWEEIKKKVSKDDYILIQFGHNDEAKEEKYKDRYTPVDDYIKNLTKFIAEAKALQAHVVLITPVTRMRFDKNGQIEETHKEYTAAMILVADRFQIPLIDLDLKSRNLLQQLGQENAKLLFMQIEPDSHPNYPEGQKDNTHFNDYGARRIAELVLQGIKENVPDLANRIYKPPVKK